MIDDRDELLNEIGRELDLEPSPAFKARVREGIAASEGRGPRTWLVPVASIATAALAFALVVRFHDVRDSQVQHATEQQDSYGVIVDRLVGGPEVEAADETPDVTGTLPAARQRETRASKRPGRHPAPAATDDVTRLDLLVLVDPGQLRGLANVVETATRVAASEEPPIVVQPIEPVPFIFAFAPSSRIEGENQ